MPYQFTPPYQDYSDYANGRVFYGAPGQAVFPVRLTSEIFLRCLAICQKQGLTEPVTVYDPCCGTAYHLATCAYLHWPQINCIIASDVDANMLAFARRNLGLLTLTGLAGRTAEIEALHERYGKESHAEALQSATFFQQQLGQNQACHTIKTHLFQANAMQPDLLCREVAGQYIDIVIADVPYGRRTQWHGAETDSAVPAEPLWQMLDSLLSVLQTHTIVAIAADKSQSCRHEQYVQRAKFQIGKRRVFLLQPLYGKVQIGN